MLIFSLLKFWSLRAVTEFLFLEFPISYFWSTGKCKEYVLSEPYKGHKHRTVFRNWMYGVMLSVANICSRGIFNSGSLPPHALRKLCKIKRDLRILFTKLVVILYFNTALYLPSVTGPGSRASDFIVVKIYQLDGIIRQYFIFPWYQSLMLPVDTSRCYRCLQKMGWTKKTFNEQRTQIPFLVFNDRNEWKLDSVFKSVN